MNKNSNGLPEVVVEVDVQDAPALNGNTADKKYIYTFDPHTAIVSKSDTRLVYQLSDKTKADFVISGIYTDDGRYQLSPGVIAADGRSISFINVNSQKMLISVMLQVTNRANKELVHADPQMLNDPELPE